MESYYAYLKDRREQLLEMDMKEREAAGFKCAICGGVIDGSHITMCKKCSNTYQKARYKNSAVVRQRKKETAKKWAIANRERYNAYQREYQRKRRAKPAIEEI